MTFYSSSKLLKEFILHLNGGTFLTLSRNLEIKMKKVANEFYIWLVSLLVISSTIPWISHMLTPFERTTERKTLKHPVYYQQTICQLRITFYLHNKLLIVKRFILNSIGDVLETHKKFGNKVEKSGKWIPSFYLFARIFHFPRVIIFDNGFDSACCIRNRSRQPR